MRLTWHASDVEAGRRLVAAHPGLGVLVRSLGAGEEERLDADGRPAAGRAERLPALGWATVDAARLAAAWAVDLEAADADDWLGGAAWRARGLAPATFLLEPSTEGRLAAALARFGEGPVALYVPAHSVDDRDLRTTPLGSATLATPARRWGPFVLLVADPARLPSSP